MEKQTDIDLSSILEKAHLQLKSRLSWRAYRVTVPEIVAMVQDEGELVGYFMFNGKQTVLIEYEGLTFQTESSELLVVTDSKVLKLSNRYINWSIGKFRRGLAPLLCLWYGI